MPCLAAALALLRPSNPGGTSSSSSSWYGCAPYIVIEVATAASLAKATATSGAVSGTTEPTVRLLQVPLCSQTKDNGGAEQQLWLSSSDG